MNEEKVKNTSNKPTIEKTNQFKKLEKLEKMILELESYYEKLISTQDEYFTTSNVEDKYSENKQKTTPESDTKSLIVIIITKHTVLDNLLKKYLFRLKMNQTIFLNSISEAVKTLHKIEKSKENVVILLDFEFLKNKSKPFIEKILKINPNFKVVSISSKNNEEITIKKIFEVGVFAHLQKPLRIKKLQEIFDSIRYELGIESSSEPEKHKLIEIFRIFKSVSNNLLYELIKNKKNWIDEQINILLENGIIQFYAEENEVICSSCKSVNTNSYYYCPSCRGTNLKQLDLIEHYRCGEVFSKESNNVTCSKCNKGIGQLGLDHQIFHNYYNCYGCGDKFPEPLIQSFCNRCGSKTKFSDIQLVKSKIYKMSN